MSRQSVADHYEILQSKAITGYRFPDPRWLGDCQLTIRDQRWRITRLAHHPHATMPYSSTSKSDIDDYRMGRVQVAGYRQAKQAQGGGACELTSWDEQRQRGAPLGEGVRGCCVDPDTRPWNSQLTAAQIAPAEAFGQPVGHGERTPGQRCRKDEMWVHAWSSPGAGPSRPALGPSLWITPSASELCTPDAARRATKLSGGQARCACARPARADLQARRTSCTTPGAACSPRFVAGLE